MAQLAPQRRPHYPANERMAILELRAARSWSLAQTARAFLVTSLTVATWMRRLDEEGPRALVEFREPVNKFPDFVSYLVRRLKTLCPSSRYAARRNGLLYVANIREQDTALRPPRTEALLYASPLPNCQ